MNKFFKQTIGILMGIFLLGSVFAAVQQWNNSKLDISQKRILFTDTGLPGGNCIMDINSGGNIIACTGIQDTLGNVYITGGALSGYLTGYTETDPIWNATSGDYVLMSVTGDWNTAYSRVNTESGNALFFRNNSGDYVLMSMTGNWNTAYGRGDHSGLYVTLANSGDYYTLNPLGYITGYTETDPIYMANSGLYYLATNPSGYIDSSALHRSLAGGILTTIDTSSFSFQVGYDAIASGPTSISLGEYSKASGTGAVAIGNNTQALDEYAISMGFMTNAYGNISTAIGFLSKANATASMALGNGTIASGTSSIAIGNNVLTNGSFSVGLGSNIVADGWGSIAIGIDTKAKGPSSIAMGTFNVGLLTSIFEIGIGTGDAYRVNALTITNTGVIKLDQLTGYACLATDVNGVIYDNSSSFVGWVDIDTGFNNTGSDTIVPSEKAVYNQIGLSLSGYQTGYEARGMTIDSTLGDLIYTKTTPNNPKTRIQMGGNATASNLYSMALGFQSYAYGDSAVAILGSAGGTSSICIGAGNVEGPSGINIGRGHSVGNNAITIGEYSEAYGENSVAIGYQNIANTKDSFAMGIGTLGNSTGGISLGSYNLGLTNSIFEIGIGLSGSLRNNAFTIIDNGNVGIKTSNPQLTLDVSGSIQSNVAFYLTGGTIPRRITLSGDNLSFQAFTGGNRLERGFFTP